MKYYKYDDEYSEIDGGVTYIETREGYAWRQITVNDERYIASNLVYPSWGMMLAEGQVDYESISVVEEINQTEFEAIWNNHLANHQAQWNKAKQLLTIGTTVQGYIQIFYPQGVIVNLGDNILGVADYLTCKISAQQQWMYPGYRVTAIIAGYDEANHWLLLDKPQVHSERMKDYSAKWNRNAA